MKLAVSTLGMPGEGLDRAIEIAAGHGCQGLELRLHPDTGVHAGLDAAGRRSVRERIERAGLEISALAGYAGVCEPGPDEPVVETLLADLRLAADLGAPGVRVFPRGGDPAVGARRLKAVAGPAADLGRRVLVETHDEMATGEAVAALLAEAACPATTGALWDLLHPWRHGEPPRRTLAALAPYLDYVQVKDAVSERDTTPVPMWTGSVPLDEAGELLRGAGFDGWVSLEWERTWYPGVAPVEEILPGAAEWVRRFTP
ncbi:sugar phosphate isomerase/epimerase [Nonomuraea sp. MG754425]|uniref:sugar phosphate isomerase/epimerase family protein n=1 Tax=Nonomuraea sp. MG754425 TaxID=2570319 RepID=UPI001F44B0F5|nr:sugar phosphate isomerase/epimerase family protein [Nonomuraea sp. MG754425]MCF6472967.1 sugar phosphate isomerase/epimerase [Nonomuraea sp. MG754425]